MPATSPAPRTTTRPTPADQASPQALWRIFAPTIAGRLQIRTRTAAGRYRHAGTLDPDALPALPAAVPIYDRQGRARCLVLDLDAKGASSRQQVLLDSARVGELASAAGLPYLIDESPNGGRHVYLPLQRPVTSDEALEVGLALKALLPSLDVAPLRNATTGAIRPPGSPHPAGGHQQLVTSLDEAVAAVCIPGDRAAWTRFRQALPADGRRQRARRPAKQPRLVAVAGTGLIRHPLEPYAEILRTGTFDPARYATPSEARYAALCHLLRRSWSTPAILAAAVDGRFPGLLRLFSKHQRPLVALNADLHRAIAKLTDQNEDRFHPNQPHKGASTPPGFPPPPTQLSPADNYRFLRSWATALRHQSRQWAGTHALVDRAVLQAVGAFAQMRGDRHVDVGCRALAQAACFDHSTVAKSLNRLAAMPDPFLVLLQRSADTDGQQGDLYELVLPAKHALRALSDPWQPGLIERTHIAFWKLPRATRYAWQALADRPCTAGEIRRNAGLADETCRQALNVLADHGLAQHVRGGWQRGHATLNQVARRRGADVKAAEVAAKHLAERRAWRSLKRLPAPQPDRQVAGRYLPAGPAVGFWSDGTPLPPEPAYRPATESEALALLSAALGATPLARRSAGSGCGEQGHCRPALAGRPLL